MSLVLYQFILEINLAFYYRVINQWLIFVSLFHCFLLVFARLYLEAHELKSRVFLSLFLLFFLFVWGSRSTKRLFVRFVN